MYLDHLGSNEVDRQATTTGLGTELFEGCFDGQSALHRNHSLGLFDDDAGIERDGYVPNVVYSCGSMKIGNQLMIPFGIADQSIGFATAKVDDILERLT